MQRAPCNGYSLLVPAIATATAALEEELDRLIEEFKAEVAAKKISRPDISMLKAKFSPSQMSALWARLKRERGASQCSVQE